MNVTVTGAAGFIGSHIVDGLLAAGYSVRGVDNLSFGSMDNLAQARQHPNFRFIEFDLKNPAHCLAACNGAHAVLHHAARVGVPDSIADPDASRRDTLDTTTNLLAAARDSAVQRFVLASTAAVYGDAPCPVREDATTRPLSPYGEHKLAAERALAQSGLIGVSLRYFNVYGPRQGAASPYAGVITRFADSIRRGDELTIFGDGQQRRDFLHVSDVVAANLAALRAPKLPAAVNIGSGVGVSMLHLIKLLAEIRGVIPRVRHRPPRQGDIRDSWADTALAETMIGFRAGKSLEVGLRELLGAA